MCGIVGIAGLKKLSDEDRSFIETSLDIMAHRGPDGQSIWTQNNIALGHRRLAIIDLITGGQPMTDVSGRYTITFNGEIYNYRELRRFLQSKGYRFATESDTEVILNAYAHWGVGGVKQLNGIFAFGVWDKQDQSLLLARDHLGVKPLLYHEGPNNLLFASEIKCLLRHPSVSNEINIFALSDYLSLGYILHPKTIIKHVNKLPPASWLLWKDGSMRSGCYWDLSTFTGQMGEGEKTEREMIVALNEQIDRAVTSQLVSDVPIGAFLSGGIDSSCVVQKMTHSNSEQVKTFSIGFEEQSFNELPYARAVAKKFNTQHYDKIVSHVLASSLPGLAWYYDEPFSDSSCIPTYQLCAFASEKVKVALSGDGGDECFAGYETYCADKIQLLYQWMPKPIHVMLQRLVNMIPATQQKVSWDYKIKQFFNNAHFAPGEAHYSWRLIFSEEEKKKILNRDVYESLDGYTPYQCFADYAEQVSGSDHLNQMIYVDFMTWLTDAMLVKVDRASMASSLEVRVPLLDYKLVEFAMSLPSEYKLRGLKTKYILKQALEPVLPKSIIHRSKKGFNAPVAKWLHDSTDYMVNGADALVDGNRILWKQLMKEHLTHRKDNSFKLWTLLCWRSWKEALGIDL